MFQQWFNSLCYLPEFFNLNLQCSSDFPFQIISHTFDVFLVGLQWTPAHLINDSIQTLTIPTFPRIYNPILKLVENKIAIQYSQILFVSPG